MRRLLLLIALFPLSACYHYGRVVPRDAVYDLQSSAEDDLGCDEVEVRQLTLFTHLVQGCGHQRVYAWEPLREEWVLDSVERPLAGTPGP